MISVKELSKSYNSGESKVDAVQKADFVAEPGSFTVILGKSGSGKSTLLTLLGGLDKADSGKIEIANMNIAKMSNRKLTSFRRTSIGFIFQSFNLVPNLTALENVMLPMEFAHVKDAERKERATKLLESVGLDEKKQQRRPGKLSGGEQQRVAIARSLANNPEVILADEPTGNLDSKTGEQIIKILTNLAEKEKKVVVVVTHDQGLTRHANQTYQMTDGKLKLVK